MDRRRHDDRRALVGEMHAAGKSMAEIARRLGIHEAALKAWIDEFMPELSPHRPPVSPQVRELGVKYDVVEHFLEKSLRKRQEKIDRIKALHAASNSFEQIADAMGVKLSTLMPWVIRNIPELFQESVDVLPLPESVDIIPFQQSVDIPLSKEDRDAIDRERGKKEARIVTNRITRAERIAKAIEAGQTVEQFADAEGVSIGQIKNYVRSFLPEFWDWARSKIRGGRRRKIYPVEKVRSAVNAGASIDDVASILNMKRHSAITWMRGRMPAEYGKLEDSRKSKAYIGFWRFRTKMVLSAMSEGRQVYYSRTSGGNRSGSRYSLRNDRIDLSKAVAAGQRPKRISSKRFGWWQWMHRG